MIMPKKHNNTMVKQKEKKKRPTRHSHSEIQKLYGNLKGHAWEDRIAESMKALMKYSPNCEW